MGRKKRAEVTVSKYEIVGLVRRNAGKKKAHYNAPEQKDMERVIGLIDILIDSKEFNDKVLTTAFEAGFETIQTIEDKSLYLFSPYNAQSTDTAIMWRFDEKAFDAFVEYNHAHGDGAEGMFANTVVLSNCRGAILNALSPDCGGTRGNKRRASDSSHSSITMFSKLHCYLAKEFPDAPFIQWHGMVGADNFALLVNSGAGRDDPEKSICVDFSNALDKLVSKEQRNKIVFSGKTASKPFRMSEKIITTNVQGRALHGGKGDSGRFAHCECSVQLRTGRRMDNFRKTIFEAVRDAFEEYSKTKIKERVKVLEEIENSDEEVSDYE